MRTLAFAVVAIGALGTSFAQNHQGPFWSLGGYGSILYPATGHAPSTPPGGLTGPYFNFSGQRPVSAAPVAAAHPPHRHATVVPYPVYYGGYGYGAGYGAGYGYDPSTGYANGYGDQAPPPSAGAAPSVVINQNFVPPQASPSVRDYDSGDSGDQQSGLKIYQAPSPHPYGDGPQQTAANDDGATIYLIAFKDHSIVQALGYWMEGSTLHYVSAEHTLNQASLNLIDRDLSQRLNSERNVEFKLPPVR